MLDGGADNGENITSLEVIGERHIDNEFAEHRVIKGRTNAHGSYRTQDDNEANSRQGIYTHRRDSNQSADNVDNK